MLKERVVRQIDNLGRVVIPKDMRLMLDVKCGEKIAFETDGTIVTISKVEKRCVFCNSKRDVITYNDKHVCRECVKMLKTLTDE